MKLPWSSLAVWLGQAACSLWASEIPDGWEQWPPPQAVLREGIDRGYENAAPAQRQELSNTAGWINTCNAGWTKHFICNSWRHSLPMPMERTAWKIPLLHFCQVDVCKAGHSSPHFPKTHHRETLHSSHLLPSSNYQSHVELLSANQ